MQTLDNQTLSQAMLGLPGWELSGNLINRIFEFEDFVVAMRFVNAIAALAEESNHHPDIDIRWNKVRLALTTHDAGGLTQKDIDLASRADNILDQLP